MIRSSVVEEIQCLLRAGRLSQRKIARRVGVSRGTVGAIAQQRRPDYEARRRQQEAEFESPAGPAIRCPDCGAMTQMPCLACRVRALLEKQRSANRAGRSRDRRTVA
jgi:transcriptional regulator with XRE-family HTH domain